MTTEEKILDNKRHIARHAVGNKPYNVTPAEGRLCLAEAIITHVQGITVQDALRLVSDKTIASVLFACMRDEKSRIWSVLDMAFFEHVVRQTTGSDAAAVAELGAIVNNGIMQPQVLDELYRKLRERVCWLPDEATAHLRALLMAAVTARQ